MSERSFGEVIDGLGIVSNLEDDELVEAALVLIKVIDADGDVRMTAAWSDGLSWIERRGMVEVARDTEVTCPEDFE